MKVLIIIMFAFFFIGCTQTVTLYREEPMAVTVMEDEPYKDSIPQLSPRYKWISPKFPFFKNKPIVLAVFPFSGKSSPITENEGDEFAEMLETELANHDSAIETYRLFNRTQLEKLLNEKELSGEGDPKEIVRSGKLPSVDAIVTGHILTTTPDRMAIILKILDKKDASIIYTERYDGKLRDILSDMVSIFYKHQVLDGYDTTYSYTTKYKKVWKKKTEMKDVPYYDNQVDYVKTTVLGVFITLGIVLLATVK